MIVVEYINAFLLAVALAAVFGIAIRARGYRAWPEMPTTPWLCAAGSWIAGTFLIGFGALVARWWSLLVSAISLVIVMLVLAHSAGTPLPLHRETKPGESDGWLVVALYFCVTLLIYFSALSLRVYLIDLRSLIF